MTVVRFTHGADFTVPSAEETIAVAVPVALSSVGMYHPWHDYYSSVSR